MSLHTSHYQRGHRPDEIASPAYGAPQTRLPVSANAAVSQRAREPSGLPTFSHSSRNTSAETSFQKRGELRGPSSTNHPSKNVNSVERPSGLPRASSSLSTSSQEKSSTLSLFPRPALSTRPSTAGSTVQRTQSALSKDRPRNVLRRKAPSVDKKSQRPSAKSEVADTRERETQEHRGSMSLPGGYRDPYPGSLLGITMPATSVATSYLPTMSPRSQTDESNISRIPKEFVGLASAVPAQQLQPSTHLIASTGSPSTRYSDSPGPWSSRTSTPTSMSSYSPGIVQPSKIGIRQRQISPTRSRPPVTRRKVVTIPLEEPVNDASQGLPPVRESLASSSSGSTVRDERLARENAERKKKKRLSPPPPSPPPRKSSMKFKSPKKGDGSDRITEQSPSSKRDRSDTESSRPADLSLPPQDSMIVETVANTRPMRPSREGISDLDVSPSPVIQSNLSPLKVIGHRRRTSADSQVIGYRDSGAMAKNAVPSPVGGSFQSRSASQIPSRYASPSPRMLQGQSAPSPGAVSSGQETALSHRKQSSKDSKDSSTAGSTKFSSRFGFFSRKSRTVPEAAADQGDKTQRKGPAAGTGHEGYGKYAQRGRRTSIGSTGGSSRGRSNSTSNSVTGSSSSRKGSVNSRGDSDIEEFLAQRLEPVVITGGGHVKGRRDSDAVTAWPPSDQSSIGSSPSIDSTAQLRQPLRPTFDSGYKSESQSSSRVQRTHDAGSILQSRMRTESPEGIEERPIPTLAARRSLHRSQHFDGEALRLPAPINTSILGPPPSLDSYDTSRSSVPQTDSTLPPVEDLYLKREIKSGKKPEKRSRALRWNFFQRNAGYDKDATTSEPEIIDVTEMPATIARIPALRPVAHYAMLDSEQDGSDTLEDLLQRVEESPPKEDEMEEVGSMPQGLGLRRQHGHSVLLPSPPSLMADFSAEARPASPRVFLHREPPPPQPAEPLSPREGRPKRLAQVGRIPLVVSKRDRQHKPAAQSFSRPFIRNVAPAPPPTLNESEDVPLEHERPILGIQTDVLPSRPFHEFDSGKPASAPEPASDVARREAYREFLVFPPRKNSTVSGSSSSEGMLSFAASNPILRDPTVKNAEDEVWNEYDDLIDHVTSPSPPKSPPKTAQSATSSQGDPFRYATMATRNLHAEVNSAKKDSMALEGAAAPVQASSVIFPISLPSDRSSDSIRLRRSRILSALGSTVAPDTPMSMSIGDFYAGYGERNRSSANILTRQSTTSSAGRTSYQSTVARPPSIASSNLAETTRQRNTVLLDIAERDRNGPIAQSNLRFGALMTSRWLSFGRVLFSPAHNAIKENRHDRILVLDGLGNDDWSFYCALTYPTASIYSLSAIPAPNTARRGSTAAWQAPPNHRTIHHPNLSQPFPFPKGFFAACVFRFPAATSDSSLRSAISECKRVLRPGGYIEMSILDLDMMNMGNRTRRAVRMLKVRMSVAEPDVSLKPASDHIQSLLGRKGFVNLNRCVVGVPVAGRVLGSRDSNSSTSRSSTIDIPQSSGGMSASTPATTNSSNSRRRRYSPLDEEEKNFSLSDVMSDHSPASDEHITKMVARVGRWWYTRCYEWAVLPNGDLERSIWADRKVLGECEKRGSGFKLLIAYAQKPVEARRRTVSEPSQPSPAVAGF